MIIPLLQELKSTKMSPIYCKTHFVDFFEMLQQKWPNKSFSEQCYLYYNHTNPGKCINCGSPTSFRGINKGYSLYCSQKCTAKSKEVQQKRKSTCLKKYGDEKFNNREKAEKSYNTKYGVSNPFSSDYIKDKIKNTIINKYGVEYASQSKDVQYIREQNTLKKYGVKHHLSLPSVIEKSRNTKLERYGDPNFNNSDKIKQSQQQQTLSNYPELLEIDNDGNWVCKCPHLDCNKCEEKIFITDYQTYYNRKKSKSECCTKLFPIGSRYTLTNVEQFVKNILDDHNISYQYEYNILYDDQTKKYKQIDFYLPDYHIGIECNGCHFHRTNLYEIPSKPKNYHMKKSDLSEKLGIRLIHIWEDWIINSPDICESIILSKLGIYKQRIGASKCKIEQIKCPEFLKNNHIQGSCPCNISYVLKYKGEIISCMTFGKRKGIVNSSNKDDEWELLRFCNKIGTSVYAGASRLLQHFIKDYQPQSIISFASRDISNGHLYEELGFEKIGKPQQSYWYIQHKTYRRYHRSTFSKSKLISMGWGTSKQTEYEIMDARDFYRIYDSGTIKYIKKL